MLFGNSPSDFGFLPPQFKGDAQIFLPSGVTATATQNFQQWVKPQGVTMVYMFAVGGGGGGGGGHSAASNNARGGGGGGGSGAYISLMIPAIFLPGILDIHAGYGGRGGTATNPGIAGNPSYISLGNGVSSGLIIPNMILLANGGSNGGAGTGAGGGAQGTAGGASTINGLGPIGRLGFYTNNGTAANAGYAGQNGTAGGAQTGAIGTALTGVWNASPFSGGTGGAGIQTPAQAGFVGGNLSLQAALDFASGNFGPASNFRAGGTAGSAVLAGGNGNAGAYSLNPFINTGGSGGGSSDAQPGGNGGAGGVGCGGGGGGGGTTGGRGGDGGHGMVVIISW